MSNKEYNITHTQMGGGELKEDLGGGSSTLTPATADTLGGVKIGNGISVTEDGTISAEGGNTENNAWIRIANKQTTAGNANVVNFAFSNLTVDAQSNDIDNVFLQITNFGDFDILNHKYAQALQNGFKVPKVATQDIGGGNIQMFSASYVDTDISGSSGDAYSVSIYIVLTYIQEAGRFVSSEMNITININ